MPVALRGRDLSDQASDDIERKPVAAGDGARAEFDYLSGHDALLCEVMSARNTRSAGSVAARQHPLSGFSPVRTGLEPLGLAPRK